MHIDDLGDEKNNADRYLIFELGQETFATPLIEVRSVIEFQEAKPIPHTAAYYKGVINIRGEIVGVIDLRERLDIKGAHSPSSQLVFETGGGMLAVTVDKVVAVAALKDGDIDRKVSPPSGGKHDRSYFLGVGKHQDKLLTLISLHKLAASEPATRKG